MSKAFRTYFDNSFRAKNKSGYDDVVDFLNESKVIQPASVYSILIKAFEATSPQTMLRLKRRGKLFFRDLLWQPARHITTLEKELQFASYWLEDLAAFINEFRNLVRSVESLIIEGNLEAAHDLIIMQRKSFGWSVWSVEMEYFVASIYKKPGEARQYLASLSEGSAPRVASFMAYIFKERNDDTVSANSFIAKCDDAFPQLSVPKNLKTYLFFRSYGHVDNIERDAPIILASDFLNSSIDYYESLIDICATIVVDASSTHLYEEVVIFTEKLLLIGIKDYRIHKINLLAGGNSAPKKGFYEKNTSVEYLLDLMLGRLEHDKTKNLPTFINKICSDIENSLKNGAAATTSLSSIFKFGINSRGLPIGQALSTYSIKLTNNLTENSINSEWGQFASPIYRVEDILFNTNLTNVQLVENFQEFSALGADDEILSKEVLHVLLNKTDAFSAHADRHGYVLIWLARRHIDNNRLPAAELVIKRMACLGPPWERHSRKLEILLAIKNEDLSKSLSIASAAVLSQPNGRSEYPICQIFLGRKWRDFKTLNLSVVGIVAYHAYLIDSDTNYRYICRMACRAYTDTGLRDGIAEKWETLSLTERQETLEFFRSVWIDDNLTMAGFQSTQEVRTERIELLQLLLQWDTVNESTYAEEIKSLTFGETLWRGLRHINETRVFVNEAAIAKWAEKELLSEFRRWKTLLDSESTNTPLVDEILGQYLAGNETSSVFMAMYQEHRTESDALLINILDRLLRKFLFDSADGLNCYLSSRIRHGTLKGTLLGPLDASGLVGNTKEDLAGDLRIGSSSFNKEQITILMGHLEEFSARLTAITERLVKQTVQIRDGNHPNGFIYASVDFNDGDNGLFSEKSYPTFKSFIFQCFDIFWEMLEKSFNDLAHHFRGDVKNEIQDEFDVLIYNLRQLGEGSTALITTIRTVATETQSQCDLVANWFQSDRSSDKQSFSLHEAIEIAKSSTKNVYRGFPNEFVTNRLSDEAVPLTPLGLSAITDALYVMLENAWKHSGLGSEMSSLEIAADMDFSNNILTISVSNPLSINRLAELKNGGLENIREKYIHNSSPEMASQEGGSGFAKLARLVRTVNKQVCSDPISILLKNDDTLIVTVNIPVYSRGDAFDAYFE